MQQPFSKPVLFVSGVMRSGTTLLHRVLTHSWGSEYVAEVDSLHVMVESFQILDSYQAFRPLGRAGFVQLYQQFLAGTFEACARHMDGAAVVLKDPLAMHTLGLLHELAPDVKFILSVRNPAATATSIYRVRNRQRAAGKTSLISGMNFGDVVEYVARLGDEIIALRDKPRVHIVRFEDLVGRDAAVTASLGRFAGVTIDLDLPDASADYNPEHAFWTAESGRPIKATSLQKHRDELTEEQSDVVASRLTRFRAAFSYV